MRNPHIHAVRAELAELIEVIEKAWGDDGDRRALPPRSAITRLTRIVDELAHAIDANEPDGPPPPAPPFDRPLHPLYDCMAKRSAAIGNTFDAALLCRCLGALRERVRASQRDRDTPGLPR
jgi:hypothetical protein